MNTMTWFLALALIGLVTGRAVGAGLAFTRGRTSIDLVAGLLGAAGIGIPLRLLGPSGVGAALPSLIAGMSGAILATWLTRVATWKAEPVLRPESAFSYAGPMQMPHDVMTTSEGTRYLLHGGELGTPVRTQRSAEPARSS